MKQVDFEKNMGIRMTLPYKTIHSLLSAWIYSIQFQLGNGNKAVMPRYGAWHVRARAAKHIYNPYYETIINYASRNVVKFKGFYYSGQVLAPTWKSYITVNSAFTYPDTELATLMSANFSLDLLLCNQFIYEMVDELIYQLSLSESVSFSNLGRLDSVLLQEKAYKNVRTGLPDSYPSRVKPRFVASKYLRDLVS